MNDYIENDDQRALRLWITAGLKIQSVRELKGNSNYLLNNMIAKYYLYNNTYKISVNALQKMKEENLDPETTILRGKLYGKNKSYLYEHMVPVNIIRGELLKLDLDACEDTIKKIIQTYTESVIIILREENKKLNELNLRSSMPEKWQFGYDGQVDDRYRQAKIDISNKLIKMRGAIKR